MFAYKSAFCLTFMKVLFFDKSIHSILCIKTYDCKNLPNLIFMTWLVYLFGLLLPSRVVRKYIFLPLYWLHPMCKALSPKIASQANTLEQIYPAKSNNTFRRKNILNCLTKQPHWILFLSGLCFCKVQKCCELQNVLFGTNICCQPLLSFEWRA